MNPRILPIVAGVFLAGCQTYSDTPSKTFRLAGDYKAIADCFYVKAANPRGYQKVDLDSMKTVQITGGSADMTVLRMDFVGVGPNTTEVRYFSGQAFGIAGWESTQVPMLKACAG